VSDITYTDAHSRSLTPLNSHLLSKLSHQIESLLKKLPTFDKLDVSCMIEFLMDVIKIHNVFDVCWPLTPSPHILHEKTSPALACSLDTTPA